MFENQTYSGASVLYDFRGRALRSPNDFALRYDWSEHTPQEVEAIWDEVVAKIPVTATSVLEIGSGSGGLAAKIKAARPDIAYLGIDLVIENVESARLAVPGCTFEVGSVWEVLEAGGSWDFVVSVATMFTYTDRRYNRELAALLDASAPKGFMIVGDTTQMPTSAFAGFLGTSTGVAASYGSGARDFLSEALLRKLSPMYIHRDSTTAVAPEMPANAAILKSGKYRQALLNFEIAQSKVASIDLPESLTVPRVGENGRVVGTETIDPRSINSDIVQRARLRGDLPTP